MIQKIIETSIEQITDLDQEPWQVFATLANERRYHIICVMNKMDGPHIEMGKLADETTMMESGGRAVYKDDRKKVYTSLQQSHLPRLEESGAIEQTEGGHWTQGRNFENYVALAELIGKEEVM